jgi:hypothetical protein
MGRKPDSVEAAGKMQAYREARLKMKARELAARDNISFEEALAIIRQRREEIKDAVGMISKKANKTKKPKGKTRGVLVYGSVLTGLSGVTSPRTWKKTK